jgi:hypothetical protein
MIVMVAIPFSFQKSEICSGLYAGITMEEL